MYPWLPESWRRWHQGMSVRHEMVGKRYCLST
jgi:hypothetical protein